jgi:Rrf2 family cysteine metabolism transcriptional repressor
VRISAKAEYGVRAMVYLARAYGQGPVPLSQVAERERVSLDFLEQLMLAQRNKGLVKSARGVHGGYMLAMHPSQVSVGAVMRAVEGPFALMQCLEFSAENQPTCGMGIAMLDCSTRDVWALLQEKITETLDSVSLADLCHEQGQPLRLAHEETVLAASP